MSGFNKLTPKFEDHLDQELFTRISLAGGIVTIGYSLFTFPAGFIEYSLFNVATGTICFISYFLSRAGKYSFSFWMFFLFIPALMFLYVYRFGLINAHLYLISGMIIVSYLVKTKKYWSEIIWIVSGAFFIGSYIVLYSSGRYQEMTALETLLFFPNVVASLVITYIATRFFRDSQESQRKELLETVELRNTLLNIISHDLRSPINSLKSLLMITDQEQMTAEELTAALNFIRAEVDSTGNMLDNLLYWSKGQTDGLIVKKELINLDPFLHEMTKLFQSQLNEKSVEIEQNLSAIELKTDREMFGIIVRNILSNAIKFSNKQAGKILVETKDTGNHIELCISDNGIGMDEDQLKMVFVVGGSKRGTSNEKGHGIGLPLVKLFCDQLNIDVVYDSKPGIGTKCTLKVPKD